MSKYDPLARYLASLDSESVTMRFAEVNALVAGGLPQSAYDHRPWWANRHDGKDAQNKGWQSVGWETGDVDLKRGLVTFYREVKRLTDFGEVTPPAAKALSIDEAKRGLALKFGVSPDQIDIHIRG